MSFIVTMGNAVDLNKEIIFGATENYNPFNLDINQLTETEKTICHNFLNIIGKHASVFIINSPYNFIDFNFITSYGVDGDIATTDYSLLSSDNKNVIDDLINLINSID